VRPVDLGTRIGRIAVENRIIHARWQ